MVCEVRIESNTYLYIYYCDYYVWTTSDILWFVTKYSGRTIRHCDIRRAGRSLAGLSFANPTKAETLSHAFDLGYLQP